MKYFSRLVITIKRADIEPRNNIGASARGPTIEPNPAKSMKSPPPIPCFLVIDPRWCLTEGEADIVRADMSTFMETVRSYSPGQEPFDSTQPQPKKPQ